MGRLLAIDYGRRRCGVAVTDTLRLVATPLVTVDTPRLQEWLLAYLASEPVDAVIVGEPLDMHGRPSDSARYIEPALGRLRKVLPPGVKLLRYDERFTSTLAHRAMLDGGLRRMARRDKATVDRTAAAIILTDFLQSNQASQI